MLSREVHKDCVIDKLTHILPLSLSFLIMERHKIIPSQYLSYAHDSGEECYFPSIEGLEAIYHSYPNATFVNVIRNAQDWFTSLQKWSHASLFVRFRLCNATGFPNGQSTTSDFYDFYEWHNNLIRQFVRDRPSINYIEVQLESPDTGHLLEDRTGIPSQCWKQCRPDSVLCEQDKDDETKVARRRLSYQKAATKKQ